VLRRALGTMLGIAAAGILTDALTRRLTRRPRPPRP
jgi:hypothetical protein